MTYNNLLAIQSAYLQMLRLNPDNPLRLGIGYQSALAGLRDIIADELGRDAEDVQNEFEWNAYNYDPDQITSP